MSGTPASGGASPDPLAAGRAPSWALPLFVFVALLALQFVLFQPILADYFPTDDEFALIVNSTSIAGPVDFFAWFTTGFSHYFVPYPEWDQPVTNFTRPLVNFIYWASHALFGERWGVQLALNYVAHALSIALMVRIAQRWLAARTLAVWCAVVVAALNPGFVAGLMQGNAISPALQFPSYGMEIFFALCAAGAVLAFLGGRFAGFFVLTTLALMSKEGAVTLPIAGLLLTGAWWHGSPARRFRNAALIGGPLVLWFVLRQLAPGLEGHSNYGAVVGLKGLLARPFKSALIWPTGLFVIPVGDLLGMWRGGDRTGAALQLLRIAGNLAWWAAVFATAWIGWRRAGGAWSRFTALPTVIVLVFALGNLGLVCAVETRELRLGHVWGLLGPFVVLATVAAMPRWPSFKVLVLAATVALPFGVHLLDSLDAPMDAFRQDKRAARSLVQVLKALPPTTRRTLLVNDTVNLWSSPEWFAKFSGYHGELIRVNELSPATSDCSLPPGDQPAYEFEEDAQAVTLLVREPPCRHLFFDTLQPFANLLAQGEVIRRRDGMTYRFPERRKETHGLVSQGEIDVPGDSMLVRLEKGPFPPGETAIVGYDFEGRMYRVLR